MHKDRPPYITKHGVITFPIYYREVPEKDPEREGKEWYDVEVMTLGEQGFNQEHEIDFASADGRLVYALHDRSIHMLRAPIKLLPHWLYILSIDPGVGVTAALFQCMTPNGYIFNIDQYYTGNLVKESEAISANIHARRIIEQAQKITNEICGKDDEGNSLNNWREMFDVALMDSIHGWRLADDMSTVSQRYAEEGLDILIPAGKDLKGSIERVKNLEEPHPGVKHPEGIEWYDKLGKLLDGAPIKYSFPHLGEEVTGYYLIEKEKWRYPDKDEIKVNTKIRRDVPVDRDDHLMACERYGCVWLMDAPKELQERKIKTADDVFYKRVTADTRSGRWGGLFN
jgi:hypothetical protein